MRILHVFPTHRERLDFIEHNVDHCCTYKAKDCSIESPTTKIMFHVITDMTDCMNIAGYEVSCAIWHYTPTPEVRQFVQSRIRYLK